MSTPDTNEAQFMVNVFDSEGNRVTTDLSPGDYKLVLEIENLITVTDPGASHAALSLFLSVDGKGQAEPNGFKVIPISESEESLAVPFSVTKWMNRIGAVALLYVGNEANQSHLFSMLELQQKVTSKYIPS